MQKNNKKLNIMAIGAHPDDVEIGCGGTLALYAAQGHKITMLAFTSGNMGTLTVPPDQLAETRKKESIASANIIVLFTVISGSSLAVNESVVTSSKVTDAPVFTS